MVGDAHPTEQIKRCVEQPLNAVCFARALASASVNWIRFQGLFLRPGANFFPRLLISGPPLVPGLYSIVCREQISFVIAGSKEKKAGQRGYFFSSFCCAAASAAAFRAASSFASSFERQMFMLQRPSGCFSSCRIFLSS